MKTNSIFNKQDTKTQEILNKYNITIPENFKFSDINIVVGSNGSGKTRFLRAVREIYRTEGKNKVMYGYFPSLSPSKNSIVKNNDLPPYTLYESLQENEFEFEDFLREVELQNEEFIPQLLTYHSRLQKERGEKTLKTLQDTFFEMSGKAILLENDVICVKDINENILPLKEVIINFSPGELMIFYMAVFLSLQKNSNKKRIIILDEPECHLHPKALLKFIKLIKQSEYFKSVWIATHSLFLIPEFDFKDIIYIENSRIYPRTSRIYKDIFIDLLGEDTERTTQFISSLSQWEYCEYIAECFVSPEVIDVVNPEDEQVKLFLEFIEKHDSMRVLDFGGGSARLGLSLKETKNIKARTIEYEIFDPKPMYTGDEFVIHTSMHTLKDKYDCVVMMNVLHEIDPSMWVEVFKNIENLLNDDSYLLFVETSVLRKGEMPNKTGYLVLSEGELGVLFSSPSPLKSIVIKNNQKSICVPIRKNILSNITMHSVVGAILSLEKTTYNNIKIERGKPDFQNSRYYAFLVQLYMNAKLFNDSSFQRFHIKQSTKTKSTKNSSSLSGIEYLTGLNFGSISYVKLAIMLRLYLDKITIRKRYILLYQNLVAGLNAIINGDNVSSTELQICWKGILLLEKEHESKDIIALFLFCLYVMGDNRCKNRIDNNGYLHYIEHIIQDIMS